MPTIKEGVRNRSGGQVVFPRKTNLQYDRYLENYVFAFRLSTYVCLYLGWPKEKEGKWPKQSNEGVCIVHTCTLKS